MRVNIAQGLRHVMRGWRIRGCDASTIRSDELVMDGEIVANGRTRDGSGGYEILLGTMGTLYNKAGNAVIVPRIALTTWRHGGHVPADIVHTCVI